MSASLPKEVPTAAGSEQLEDETVERKTNDKRKRRAQSPKDTQRNATTGATNETKPAVGTKRKSKAKSTNDSSSTTTATTTRSRGSTAEDINKLTGLNFPVQLPTRALKAGKYSRKVGSAAPVYMAAVLEYMTTEMLELAGNLAEDPLISSELAKRTGVPLTKKTITPQHLQMVLNSDAEFRKLVETLSNGETEDADAEAEGEAGREGGENGDENVRDVAVTQQQQQLLLPPPPAATPKKVEVDVRLGIFEETGSAKAAGQDVRDDDGDDDDDDDDHGDGSDKDEDGEDSDVVAGAGGAKKQRKDDGEEEQENEEGDDAG